MLTFGEYELRLYRDSCTILKLLCTENIAKIKYAKNKRIILLKCLKRNHTINVTQKSVSKASD